jgi:serine protease Do
MRREACIVLLALIAGGPVAARAQELNAETLRGAYARIAPALGLVKYSSQITNPASGEISRRDANALGLVVSADGLVMTHGHMVLENAEPFNVTVTLGRGDREKVYPAEVLPKPDDVNITFLRLQPPTPETFSFVRFSRENALHVGAPVALIGVLGETLDFMPSLLESRVAAEFTEPRKGYCIDGAFRFGYVGAPVVDAAGRVVGVIGFDLARNEGGDLYVRSGHPLIYQTELFAKYLSVPPSGAAAPAQEEAWLGVFTQPLTAQFVEYWQLPMDGGLIVSTVVPGSPAAEAGLRPGDIVTRFAGKPIRARQDRDVLGFTKLVRDTGPGKTVEIEFLRDKVPNTLQVTLGVRPRTAEDAAQYEDKVFGLTVRDLTTDVRIAMNLGEELQGVIVRRVKSGSPAQIAKVMPGVIILAIGDMPVRSVEDYRAALERLAAQKPAEISIFARAGSATGFFRISPRWDNAAKP